MNKYNEFMNKIEVTDEMRERILKNVRNADIQPKKQSFFIKYRGWIAAAACFALIVVGAVTVTRLGGQNIVSPPGGVSAPEVGLGAESEADSNEVLGWWEATECGSVDELSQEVGFAVKIPAELPFDHDSEDYIALADNMAQVTWYSGEERTAWFRQQEATGDISGDFSQYETEKTLELNGAAVTAKGNGDLINLAYWNVGGTAYSLTVEGGITEQQLADFVTAVM